MKAIFDDQRLLLKTPVSGSYTASPVSVSLASTLTKGSKAKRSTVYEASFYLGKGVRHTRREKIHGKVRTVVSYLGSTGPVEPKLCATLRARDRLLAKSLRWKQIALDLRR